MRSDVQPFWTWPASILLAAVALLCASWFAEGYVGRQEASRMGLERLRAQGAVVALGNSKFRCGILFDRDMSAALAAHGAPAPFIRISAPGAFAEDLDFVFDAIERAPPRLLLVESDYLALEPAFYQPAGEPGRRPGWRSRVRWALKLLRSGDSGFYAELTDYNSTPRACTPANATPVTPEDYAAELAGRRVSTAAERRELSTRLKRLQARGTTIALIQTPRSPAYASGFPSEIASAAQAILDRSVAENHWVLIGAPSHLKAGDFFDAGHLNDPGRQSYSAWLSGQIADRLKRGGAA